MKQNILLVILISFLGLLIYPVISFHNETKKQTVEQLVKIAKKTNCVPVEQSYNNPDKFYLYCGNDIYKVIYMSEHKELLGE
jgi:hypothetical protein